MSLADALAFEELDEATKRVAYAGVMLHERMDKAREEGRIEGFDAGRASIPFPKVSDAVHDVYERLLLFRQGINPNDTRYAQLGEIIADLGKAIDGDPR